jgi:hypothetical protein
MMFLFEIIRLYLGYVGNLCERVPELTGFWLLTMMVEIPLSTFLLVIAWFPIGISGTTDPRLAFFIPMQFVLEVIHALFVYAEIGFGLFALRVLARYQISRFHYKQFDAYEVNMGNATPTDLDSDDWLHSLGKNNNFEMKDFKVKVLLFVIRFAKCKTRCIVSEVKNSFTAVFSLLHNLDKHT